MDRAQPRHRPDAADPAHPRAVARPDVQRRDIPLSRAAGPDQAARASAGKDVTAVPGPTAPPSRKSSEALPLIEFRNVGKTFARGALEAVRDVNLSVAPGEFLTLVGPSGCGKSTLLNMTAGLFLPTTGEVRYAGAVVADINVRVGYMTQVDHLLPWRTLAGNIAVPLEIAGRPKREIAAEVERLMTLVGLTGFGASYPSQLSGGMRKRAALARLFAYDPETLLMDEPFAALDAQMRLVLQVELKRLCRLLGKTVLFVTHDVDEAVALGDRCIVFTSRPGRVRQAITVDLPGDRDLRVLRYDPAYLAQCGALWRLLTPPVEPAVAPQGRRE
ncbi:MAG: ABC transporter ATP-binding protein [Alphaproteobacteria bacterium]|nr:ABC transporter ATP-binding protein [Alphaproteobacteria bacterium]